MNIFQAAQKSITILCLVFVVISRVPSTAQANDKDRSTSRIVGGVNVTPVNKYPMIVSFQTSNGFHGCAGTILNKYFVLTSVNCIRISNPNIVIAGIYQLKDPDRRYLQNNTIDEVTLHPGFNTYPDNNKKKWNYANDIAVIKVTNAWIWNDYVTPTNLPPPGWTVLPYDEVKATVAGWGQTRDGVYPQAPLRPLQEVELPLVTTDICQRRYSSFKFTDEQICLKGVGSCQYDWGNPLFIYNEKVDKHIQIGIHSFIPANCSDVNEKESSAGYTKISKYLGWIDDAIRECSPLRGNRPVN